MSKRRPPLDVAECVHATSRSFEAIVHFDKPAIGRLNPSRRKLQRVRIRHAPCSHKQMRTGEDQSRSVALLLYLQSNVPVCLSNANHFGVQQDLNSILLKNLCDFFRDVGVFASEQLSTQLNNCHAAAETPEELSKLHTDVTATQYQQVLGNGIEFHDGYVVEGRNVVQAVQFGPGRAGTGIDKDIFA